MKKLIIFIALLISSGVFAQSTVVQTPGQPIVTCRPTSIGSIVCI